MNRKTAALPLTAFAMLAPGIAGATVEEDRAKVAALDVEYQAAVKVNDVATMDRILHPDFALVRGNGGVVTREDIMSGARDGSITYEKQDEEPGTQFVRVWGDTAVVTAKLWVKGVSKGQAFDRKVWFSDTYVRTPEGWRYAFAQVSLPLPAGE